MGRASSFRFLRSGKKHDPFAGGGERSGCFGRRGLRGFVDSCVEFAAWLVLESPPVAAIQFGPGIAGAVIGRGESRGVLMRGITEMWTTLERTEVFSQDQLCLGTTLAFHLEIPICGDV